MPTNFRTLKSYTVLCIILAEKLLASLTKFVIEQIAVFKWKGLWNLKWFLMCQIIQTTAETATILMNLTRGLYLCFKKLIRSIGEPKFRSSKICFSQDQIYSAVEHIKNKWYEDSSSFLHKEHIEQIWTPMHCTAVSVCILLCRIFHKAKDFAGGTAADQMLLPQSEWEETEKTILCDFLMDIEGFWHITMIWFLVSIWCKTHVFLMGFQ